MKKYAERTPEWEKHYHDEKPKKEDVVFDSMRSGIEWIINSNESAYSIEKNSGVTASIVKNLRLGKRKIDNISLKSAEKLYEYAKKVNKNT